MYIRAETLDDLLRNVFARLLKSKNHVSPTKGDITELSGVLLKISNPRTRLSRTETRSTLFTCLGEFLWYLSGSNKLPFIKYYIRRYSDFSDDNKTIFGGYGPRMFGKGEFDQVNRIIDLLSKKSGSRRAVVQLFSASDLLEEHKDIPCTSTLQFLVRRGRLNLIVNMRSNDAYMGLPHDVFAFTMVQELVARALGVELGTYIHMVGSLHLYDTNRKDAEKYLSEGWQSKVPMPAMPLGDQRPALKLLLKCEAKIRNGNEINFRSLDIDPYWKDLIRILQIFQYTNDPNKLSKVYNLKKAMTSDVYNTYIAKRHATKMIAVPKPLQMDIFDDATEQ